LGDVVLAAEPTAGNHQQAMVVGMGAAILAARDLGGAHPSQDSRELRPKEKPLPGSAHGVQRGPQAAHLAVAYRERQHQPAVLGVLLQQSRQRLEETGFPHERPPPLADRTDAATTEPCLPELECGRAIGLVRPAEQQRIRTAAHALAVGMIAKFGYHGCHGQRIGFVAIPGSVLGAVGGEVIVRWLRLIDGCGSLYLGHGPNP
jgi:hypothetical protein